MTTRGYPRKRKFGGLKGRTNGIEFDSGYEKKFIRICRQLGIRLIRSKASVRYKDALGKWHTYYPDFYWPDLDYTVEIKGAWAFATNHGHIREKYQAAMVAFNGRYTILTEKELKSEFINRLHKERLQLRA